MREVLRILRQLSVRYFHDIIYQFSYLVKLKENRQRRFFLKVKYQINFHSGKLGGS